jgi:hypothetical protein
MIHIHPAAVVVERNLGFDDQSSSTKPMTQLEVALCPEYTFHAGEQLYRESDVHKLRVEIDELEQLLYQAAVVLQVWSNHTTSRLAEPVMNAIEAKIRKHT